MPISQVMERLNRGEPASRRLILYASDMLEFANRTKGGKDYKALDDALLRLSGCRIKTNIRTGDIYHTKIFGLIESGDLIRKYGFNGRLPACRGYAFRMVVECSPGPPGADIAPGLFPPPPAAWSAASTSLPASTAASSPEWQISLDLLHRKCGSRSRLREFRRSMRKLVTHGDLLDYAVTFDAGRDMVTFRRMEGSLVDRIPAPNSSSEIELPESVATEARRRHGPTVDLASAERDWRGWMARKGVRPTNPPALFLSFLATWIDRQQTDLVDEDDALDWIGEMATEWWETLDEAEQQALRLQVGERIELSDGEGWFRSEASMARDAFDRRWRHQHCPPERMEIPPQLLARAVATAGPDVGPDDIEAGWREWIVGQPHWMQNMAMRSVISYAEELAGQGSTQTG